MNMLQVARLTIIFRNSSMIWSFAINVIAASVLLTKSERLASRPLGFEI